MAVPATTTKAQERKLDTLRQHAKTYTKSRKQFEQSIVAARNAGLAQRTIAQAAGVTHRTVQVILAKHEAAA